MNLQLTAPQVDKITRWLGTGSINIFGLPYAGKDTHAHELAASLSGVMLSSGDILRNSVIPEHVRLIMEQGELVPTVDFKNIVVPYLSQAVLANKPLILSSFGRWHGEEPGVVEALKQSGHTLKAVIYLEVDEQTVLDRWHDAQHHTKRGDRNDDDKHKLATRFEEFNQKTLPVIDYYQRQGLLHTIDGRPEAANVSKNILDVLCSLADNT